MQQNKELQPTIHALLAASVQRTARSAKRILQVTRHSTAHGRDIPIEKHFVSTAFRRTPAQGEVQRRDSFSPFFETARFYPCRRYSRWINASDANSTVESYLGSTTKCQSRWDFNQNSNLPPSDEVPKNPMVNKGSLSFHFVPFARSSS